VPATQTASSVQTHVSSIGTVVQLALVPSTAGLSHLPINAGTPSSQEPVQDGNVPEVIELHMLHVLHAATRGSEDLQRNSGETYYKLLQDVLSCNAPEDIARHFSIIQR
jgi:hypothetical protein